MLGGFKTIHSSGWGSRQTCTAEPKSPKETPVGKKTAGKAPITAAQGDEELCRLSHTTS